MHVCLIVERERERGRAWEEKSRQKSEKKICLRRLDFLTSNAAAIRGKQSDERKIFIRIDQSIRVRSAFSFSSTQCQSRAKKKPVKIRLVNIVIYRILFSHSILITLNIYFPIAFVKH